MAALYSSVCEKFILPLADVAIHHRVMRSYKFYKESQWWDRQRLISYQNTCLSKTLKIAYKEVPFYKNLYDSYLVDINNVSNITELPLLPFVTKDMLRASYPDKCTRSTKWPWREYCTSGSSGKPFAVRVDNMTMSHARALMLLRTIFSGWNIGEPFLQTGMTLDRGIVKRLKDILMRAQYVSAFNLSDPVLDHYLDLIERKKLKYIMGYAGSMYCLASRASETRCNLKLKGVVSWGDNLYQHYRDKIEKTFGCRVTDTYGCGEGIQIAAQCGLNNGAYHVFMPHVVVEIVDDEGQPVNPGESGNVVLTRLDPGAMPLLRYKVGDIARKSTDESCPCGRGLEMLTKIDGRDTDVIVTPNGNRLIVHFFTGILEYYQSVDTFKVIQEKSGEIIIEIVPRPDFQDTHWEQIKGEILQKGDPHLKIEMKIVKDIPLEISNKRRFVVSMIK
ncbi:phenylacetate--CoA ligase family protein [Desulfopila sp. IMCC35006]|uniref:phenylacetate--CoA ligase family protein n=1 Tax=Desulfopila sp. IMCC35006 TaxID=2569542 RepID=UPI0010AD3018|nr:AMP-binding protein [Desulfopila sp. IMCC35006]TKB23947.1 phenylacetate--CoA ligase family protein [Desulfopila sp. IMCC35006]